MAQHRFGRFVLNHDRGCLQGPDGRERALRPKSFRLLAVLAERAGTLVEKDELARIVWPDVFVSDDSVAHCVSDIRKALGPDGARHIRTVPRRGYMFLPETETAESEAETTGEVHRRLPVGAGRWAAGAGALALTGALVAALVAAVIPWPAPDAPGDAPSGFAGGGSPGLVKGDAAGREIAAMVRRATNLLDERDWTRRQDNEAARALLERVVAAEPGHAEAWAALGLTYWREVEHLAWAGGRREMRRALEMVERSVRLGASASARRLLAEMRLLSPFEEMRSPADALALARSAVALAPDDPDSLAILAETLALTGRADEAVGLIERARRLNPNYPAWYDRVAGIGYLLAGDAARAAIEFAPLYDEEAPAHARSWSGWLLAASLAHAGRHAEAAEVVASVRRRRPGATLDMVASSLDGFDDPAALRTVLDGLRRAGMPG